jgi:hypothetical protein
MDGILEEMKVFLEKWIMKKEKILLNKEKK